ncbi:sensor histidine kinase [Microcella sp.]|uniref:sensor histidine kinase n=1 Tax=Microcella sp. TaxID=1913979 RepID=UPI00256725A6|nr:histidine kinase [Microcella sp.]MBX9470416.1 hypothetical protein [Microcella sp.]
MTMHPALVRSRTGVLVADGITGFLLWILSGAFATLSGADADAGLAGRLVLLVAGAVMAAAVTVRRLHPGWALGLAWASTLVHTLAGLDASLTQIGVLVVLASAAHYGSTRVLTLSGVSVAVGAIIAVAYLVLIDSWLVQLLSANPAFPAWLPLALLVALVGLTLSVPWLVGLVARTLRLGREGRERARIAQDEARRASEIAELQAARTVLARDVHDIVGHSLAVIIAQAESVRFRDVDDPEGLEAVRGTVGTIADTARRALGEVRHVLETTAVTGEGGAGLSSGEAHTGLDLTQLLDDVERSRPGMTVEWAEGVRLPRGESAVALYRAVQELLTNALRHGEPTAPVLVRVDADPASGDIEVEIENTVAMASSSEHPWPRDGTGLDGARSRLQSAGGSLEARALDGVFTAKVRLPAVGEPS